MIRIYGLIGLLALSSCGKSNFNKIWGSAQIDDGALVEAQLLYNKGEFTKALDLVEEVLAHDDENVKATVLKGYIHMSVGGLDLFQLAGKLIDTSSTEKTAEGTSKLTAESSSSSASDILKTLGAVINISEDDFNILGTVYGEGEEKLKTDLFVDNQIIIPAKPKDVRSQVNILNHMNLAIETICPYISSEAFPEGSVRYSEKCKTKKNALKENARLSFLWAFSHLAEAMVYQTVLLYSGTSSADSAELSNFENATKGMDQFKGNLVDFSNALTDMTNAVDAVFDTDDPNSMISETLNSMKAASLGLAQVKGMPKSLSESVTKAVDSIDKLGEKLGGGVGGNTKALKGEMTKKFAADIKTKVDSAINKKLQDSYGKSIDTFDPNELSTTDKQKFDEEIGPICENFETLSATNATLEKPESCTKFALN